MGDKSARRRVYPINEWDRLKCVVLGAVDLSCLAYPLTAAPLTAARLVEQS